MSHTIVQRTAGTSPDGIDGTPPDRDLDALGGGWSDRDEAELLDAIAPLGTIDEALWR